jgi:hypothetical protein
MALFLIIVLPIAFAIFIIVLYHYNINSSYPQPTNTFPTIQCELPISNDFLHENICVTSERLGVLLAMKRSQGD